MAGASALRSVRRWQARRCSDPLLPYRNATSEKAQGVSPHHRVHDEIDGADPLYRCSSGSIRGRG